MAVSLEARVPILDHRVGNLRCGCRLAQKSGTASRNIPCVRCSIGTFRLIRRSKKHGFGVPLDDWLRGDLKWLLNEYLDEPRMKKQTSMQTGAENSSDFFTAGRRIDACGSASFSKCGSTAMAVRLRASSRHDRLTSIAVSLMTSALPNIQLRFVIRCLSTQSN